MRKLFSFNMVSLDGFFEGQNKWDLSWHNTDDEFNEFAVEQMEGIDMLIFGRVTYEGMASYWPSSEALTNDPIIASLMNTIPKIVFSKTLEKVEWNNTRLVNTNIREEVL